MFKFVFLLAIIFSKFVIANAQGYTPTIEHSPCLLKVDARLKSVCGFLVVPENRQKPTGNKVKIPFVFARRPDQDSSKDITLYTTGGPGYTTISVGDSLRFNSDRFAFGGFIFFDQRGTKNAIPCLDCEGIDEAIKNAYLHDRAADSLIAIAVTKCRKKFEKQGIDLSAYNTIESASDISDLKKALHIDSLTLFGISYSGGLMLTVARNHPEGIKALILNSPLPGYVNYEEHALLNHNEALDQLFDNLEADSTQSKNYPQLRQRFRTYFTSIHGKSFFINFLDTATKQQHKIRYTRNELLDAVIDRMTNSDFQSVPGVIDDLIKGNHEKYIQQALAEKFTGRKSLSYGMRLSVYCSEQIAYSDESKLEEQNKLVPWLAGYPFNNVNHQICDCWKVKPVPQIAKTPVYSNIPALITAGSLDPWTRPFYNRLIKRTMPNAQLLIISDRAHGAGFGGLLGAFIADPFTKLVSTSKNVVLE